MLPKSSTPRSSLPEVREHRSRDTPPRKSWEYHCLWIGHLVCVRACTCVFVQDRDRHLNVYLFVCVCVCYIPSCVIPIWFLWFLQTCLSHPTVRARACVCTCACVCSELIPGPDWSCRPRGRSLAEPTQFFHIRHCNCSCWPGCLRPHTHSYTCAIIHTSAHTYMHVQAHTHTHTTQELPPARGTWKQWRVGPSPQPMGSFVTRDLLVFASDG